MGDSPHLLPNGLDHSASSTEILDPFYPTFRSLCFVHREKGRDRRVEKAKDLENDELYIPRSVNNMKWEFLLAPKL